MSNIIILLLLFIGVNLENVQQQTNNNDPNLEPDSNCTLYRDNLANAISNFTSCAIKHSRPITFCESCIDFYLNIKECYKNITEAKADGGGHCIDEYINWDRLEIVGYFYKSSLELWKRAKCYECFQLVDNKLIHNTSEQVYMFNSLFNLTKQCINQTNSNAKLFCTDCIDEYMGLDDYYKSISNLNENIGMCMDIVDLMNVTRDMWSKNCCEYRRKPEYIFIGSTVAVLVLTILFYILAKYCTDLKNHNIIRQSRLAESLNNIQ